MRIISHRGNVEGFAFEENSQEAIKNALSLGFDVEFDLWVLHGCCRADVWLGHDSPQVCIKDVISSLGDIDKMWLHCKDVYALDLAIGLGANAFWHQTDQYTITNRGNIWCYPGMLVPKNGVCVLPKDDTIVPDCYAICTDKPLYWKGRLNE